MFRFARLRYGSLIFSIGMLLAACGNTPNTTSSGSANPSAAAGSNTGASSTLASTSATTAVNAVATTSIIADLVKNVGGDRVSVRTLLPAGTDPHTFAPSPSDVQAVADAHILFENGLGLEEWLAELTQNAGGDRTTIVVSEGLTPITGFDEQDADAQAAEQRDQADSAASSEPTPDEQGADPHMWQDVQYTIGYVENIRDGLKQVDPAGSSAYDSNAAAYIDQLKQLDTEIVQQVSEIPQERRKLITNHDTFGYFAKRYGFAVLGSVFENVSTEQEPSAQQIAELVQQIRAQGVTAIFTENTVNPRLAEQVANEAGIRVVTSLYTDALGEPGSDGDTYIKMMRSNVQQIVEVLK